MRRIPVFARLVGLLVFSGAAFLGNQGCGVPLVPVAITITSPPHGTFTLASSVILAGTFTGPAASDATVLVNGAPATVNADRTWSLTVPVNTERIMNPYEAVLGVISTGATVARHRIVLLHGQSRADGAFSEQSVALRLSDAGLDQVEPLIEGGVDLHPPSLLAP